MLGFYEIDGGAGNAVLASGDTRLVLREVAEAAPVSRRLVHLNLEVGDVEAAYEELSERASGSPTRPGRSTGARGWSSGRPPSATPTATASPSPSGANTRPTR